MINPPQTNRTGLLLKISLPPTSSNCLSFGYYAEKDFSERIQTESTGKQQNVQKWIKKTCNFPGPIYARTCLDKKHMGEVEGAEGGNQEQFYDL